MRMRWELIECASSPFSSPEPVISWSRGPLEIKPTGSGDENGLFPGYFVYPLYVTSKKWRWISRDISEARL